MNRTPLLESLNVYKEIWLKDAVPGLLHDSYSRDEESNIFGKFVEFIQSTSQCFERTHAAGHVTGSAIVVSADFQEVLLTLHAKLNMWLQLGGHADGNHLVHEVAASEVREESGLDQFSFFDWQRLLSNADQEAPATPVPFDLDAHWIPPNSKDPGHWHYDIRYVIVAPREDTLAITSESLDLRWFQLSEARTVTSERSMHRQFDKVARFGNLLRERAAACAIEPGEERKTR